jgi:hypothetical protein
MKALGKKEAEEAEKLINEPILKEIGSFLETLDFN